MRRILPLALSLVLMLALAPSAPAAVAEVNHPAWLNLAMERVWSELGDSSMAHPPPSPVHTIEGWTPSPAGTERNLYLDTGPHVIMPGQDLSRLDPFEAPQSGYTLETRMFVLDATDGSTVNGHQVHTHHAHLVKLQADPDAPYSWIYGTGEEMTGGSVDARAAADPAYKKGLRYGMYVEKGDTLGVLSMLHNKTSEPRVVYLRVWTRMVTGTHEEIQQATGQDFHTLAPAIFGGTFNVPRARMANFYWPADVAKNETDEDQRGSMTAIPSGNVKNVPGTGVVWTAPWDGQIVVAGGHLHAGGTEAYISNWGSEAKPCANRDGDRLAGTTIFRSAVFERHGFPSEDYQMGLSQNGWRAWVHKGDRLVVNGGYDTRRFAYPDAMVFFGIYVDTSVAPPANASCSASLIGKPKASRAQVTRSVINHPWSMYPEQHLCHGECDTPAAPPEKGMAMPVIHIADFAYLPGQPGLPAPVVAKGDPLMFVNDDYAAGLVRHTITTCKFPCNGPAMANYPFPDGVIDSGPLGYMVEDAYVSYQTVPVWELDTTNLNPGFYSYYCRLHAFMRGGFYVE